jgi:enoyl-CoA hydratase/carnithine racemase
LQPSQGIVTLPLHDLNGRNDKVRELQMSTAPATAAQPDDPALLRIDGPIATITLNRPAAFNSINLAIAQRLEQLAAEVEANDDIRVLVIEGEGRAFCAGGDLQTIGAAAASDTIAPVVGELLRHYHAFITTLRKMPKLVLSSVHGSAAGAGMSLAFIADLCIATEDARFTPAYHKLGVSPDGGGTVGVVATVGVRRAELKAATREFAMRLAQTAPSGIATTKALIHQAPRTSIEQQLDAERDGIIDCMHTEDFKAAVKRFTSKGK